MCMGKDFAKIFFKSKNGQALYYPYGRLGKGWVVSELRQRAIASFVQRAMLLGGFLLTEFVVDSRSRASIFEKRPRKFGDRGAKRAREMILVRLIAAMSFPVLELNFSVSPGRGEKRNLKGIYSRSQPH